jgi:hypothetical protein
MATQAYAYTRTFTQTHSIVFLSDNLRNTLREVIRENGLSPDKLMQDWETIESGIRTWLGTGHLNNIVVEFYKPGASVAAARWEFPIGYAGSGVDDDSQVCAPGERLHIPGSPVHEYGSTKGRRLHRLHVSLNRAAGRAPGWHGYRHRPHDGWGDILEVG